MSVSDDRSWIFLGEKLPRSEIIYFTQILLLFIVISTAIANLSLETGNEQLWITLLCSSVGYILPSPHIKSKRSNGHEFQPNLTQQ